MMPNHCLTCAMHLDQKEWGKVGGTLRLDEHRRVSDVGPKQEKEMTNGNEAWQKELAWGGGKLR